MINAMRHSRAGFTLVELIVVIAILGILAGIAVPVYSGYIDKASEAADLQLLGAMNTAFSAACASRGVDPTQINAAVATEGSAGSLRVTGLSVPGTLNDDFLLFYGENVDKPFKTFSSIGYDRESGIFVGDSGVMYFTTTLYGQEVTLAVNVEDIQDFNDSTFGELGSTAVLDQVNKVVQGAKATLAQMSDPSRYPQFTQGFVTYLKEQYGMTDEQISAMTGEQRANALVMMVASKAKDLDVQSTIAAFNNGSGLDLQGMVEGGNATVDLATNMTVPFALAMAYANSDYADVIHTGTYTNRVYNTEEEALAAAEARGADSSAVQLVTSGRYAGMYRMSTDVMSATDFFYNGAAVQWTSSGGGGRIGGTLHGANNLQNTNDVMDMVTIISDSDGFKAYMQSAQAQADLEGFVGAMNMLDANAGNISTADLLANGFGDTNLQSMVASILGG